MFRLFCIIYSALLLPAILKAQVEVQVNISQVDTTVSQRIAIAKALGKTDTSLAARLFLTAIREAKVEENFQQQGTAYYAMAEMFHAHKNHNRAFGAFYNARECFQENGSRKQRAWTLFGLGRAQYYRGNYKVAAQHLNFAMRDATQLGLADLESDALEYLGMLYHLMAGTAAESIPQFKHALYIKEQLDDQPGILRMLQKLGLHYYAAGRFDSSLIFLNRAVLLARSHQQHEELALTLLERAATHVRLGNLEDASVDINYVRSKGDSSDINTHIRCLIREGDVAVARLQLEQGLEFFNRALKVADQIGVPDMYALVYGSMSDAFSMKGMFAEAYRYSRLYTDHLRRYYAENAGSIRELEFIFNTTRTRDELAWLSLENKLKDSQLGNARRFRIFLIVTACLFLLLCVLIFRLYRAQRRKNTTIRNQATDLQTLIMETHHRVKNNLQVISSLLDLQSMIVKDDHAVQAIREGRDRVKSMALIHQHLYSEGSLKAIPVAGYIRNLCRNLFHSYNISPDRIVLQLDIEELDIDIDTVIPLGLLLNEIISNSLKYAFVPGSEGKIEVVLKETDGRLVLRVTDNGKGFPDVKSITESRTFGMRMIRMFAQKLKAELDISNHNGACIIMHIKNYRLA